MAVIAMLGISLVASAQGEIINGKLTIIGSSSSQGYSHIFSTERGKTDFRLTTNVLNAENAYLYNYNQTARTFHTINIGGKHSLTSGITVLGNGNVGIGTSNPTFNLDISSSNSGIRLKNTDPYSWAYLRIHGSGSKLWDIAQYGNNDFLEFIPNNSTATVIFKQNGNAAIQGKLEVKEIKVTNTPTADFVFEEDYNLPTLKSIERHIKEKKHLPEIASAKEMEKNGVNVGNFQIQLLQKIEELTLYTIDQEKKIKSLENQLKEIEEMKKQNAEIKELKALVQKLLKNKGKLPGFRSIQGQKKNKLNNNNRDLRVQEISPKQRFQA